MLKLHVVHLLAETIKRFQELHGNLRAIPLNGTVLLKLLPLCIVVLVELLLNNCIRDEPPP